MTKIIVTPDNSEPTGEFDLLVVALGYETRSLFIAERYMASSKRRIAVAFRQRQVGSYQRNRAIYEQNDFTILPYQTDDFITDFVDAARQAFANIERDVRVLVDISSMSRPMIASVVVALERIRLSQEMETTFVYCPAQFTNPVLERNPVTVSEPVIPELAGWSLRPENSVAAIVGLGFEYDQALGTVEFLEPAAAWTFAPYGEDEKFDAAVYEANADLLQTLQPEQVVRYDVRDPYKCFIELEALTYGVMADMRPIIVPFGPKLFALLSVLIGIIHAPNVTVWRVSGDQLGVPDDRIASGTIVPFKAVFSNQG